MLLLCLLVLFYHVWVRNTNTEVYWVCYWVVRLSVFARWIWISVITVDPAGSCLLLQILVIPSLLFLFPDSFHFFCLVDIDLVAVHVILIVQFLFSFPRFPSLLFLNLILKKTLEHILLIIHSGDSFFLIFKNSLLKLLNLSSLEIVSMLLSFPVNNRSLVFVYIVKSVLILHKLIVVLLVN